jgi:SUN domain-containing protein 1/2
MTKRAFAPATFYLRQRSQEPSAESASAPNGHNRQNASYDYSAEEREFQSQKPSSPSAARATPHHKKGRMSLDNKAYRPSASDLDDSDDDDDDGRKVRRRKSKKTGPHGGPLTTLPTVAGHEKKRRRKGRGSKGNALDMDEDDSTGLSDEHHTEQVSAWSVADNILANMFSSGLQHSVHLRPIPERHNTGARYPFPTKMTTRARSTLQWTSNKD